MLSVKPHYGLAVKKPFQCAFYVLVVKEVTLKARGQAITTAVDVAEIARNRFVKDLKVSKIAIGTVEMPPREGENKSRMVSTMEITLVKK